MRARPVAVVAALLAALAGGCARADAEQADGSIVYRQAGDRLISLVFD